MVSGSQWREWNTSPGVLCDKVPNSSSSVAWEYMESCEDGEKFKARLCTLVTHLGKFSHGTLVVLAHPKADAHEKRVVTPAKCNNLNIPKYSQAPLESRAQCSSQLD